MMRGVGPLPMRGAAKALLCAACLFATDAAAQGSRLEALTATRDRPLFSPTRRPPPPPQAVATPTRAIEAPPPEASPPAIQLIGIIFGDNEGIAIVKHAKDATTTRLRVGDAIDNWIVQEIRPRDVRLKLGTRTVMVRLSSATPEPETPDPAFGPHTGEP